MEAWMTPFLHNMLVQLPPILVEVAGLIVALVWWRRHPSVSLTFLLSVGLLILTNIVGAFLFAWLPTYLRYQQGWTAAATSHVLTIINVGRSSVAAVAWILLLCAVFGGRSSITNHRIAADKPAAFTDLHK